MRNRTIANDRARIDSQHAAMLLNEGKRAIERLIAAGYPKHTSLHSTHRDLCNGGYSLSDRVGRGFTA